MSEQTDAMNRLLDLHHARHAEHLDALDEQERIERLKSIDTGSVISPAEYEQLTGKSYGGLMPGLWEVSVRVSCPPAYAEVLRNRMADALDAAGIENPRFYVRK